MPAPEEQALQEAADWLLLLRSNEAGAADHARWQAWLAARPEHARAWRLIDSVTHKFSSVPSAVAANALTRKPSRRTRRSEWLGLCALVTLGAVLWAVVGRGPAPAPPVELRAATGEQRSYTLADGTRVTADTASRATAHYDDQQRFVRLHAGALLIETAADAAAAPRPFVVETAQGRVEPIGTRFTVRLDQGGWRLETGGWRGGGVTSTSSSLKSPASSLLQASRVTVLEGRVRLRPANGAAVELRAGESTAFTATAVEPPQPADAAAAAWIDGLLVADDQPLCSFLAELNRYRSDRLLCNPRLETRRISGVYSLQDPQQVLDAVTQTLGLRAERLSYEELRVQPRD